MNRIKFCVLLWFISANTIAQDCNRSTLIKRLASTIPLDICIPNGFIIDEIYDSTDVDGDRLAEYIFSWRRDSLVNGDTIFVSIYHNEGNKKFTHLRTLPNLFPIYFHSYSILYNNFDRSLGPIFKKFNGWNPLQKLDILKSNITIQMERSAGEGLLFTYTYRDNDWILTELNEWEEDALGTFTTKAANGDRINTSITRFNYLDYTY
jgi:hypothetical protein